MAVTTPTKKQDSLPPARIDLSAMDWRLLTRSPRRRGRVPLLASCDLCDNLDRRVVADDKAMIEHAVKSVLGNPSVDAAIFSGGTGITSSDVTIETVSAFFEKTLPGFGEIFRKLSYDRVGSAAVMSRAVAGVAKGKALFCIPGSPDAVRISVELLISPEAPHIVKHARE